MEDRFSHWPEAIPLNDTTTTSCAQTLVFHWIAHVGILIDMSSTTAYHPQSNGLVDRFHHHLKSTLRVRFTGPNWTRELPWMLLGIRTVPREDLECSSAELVYGAPLTVPGDFIPNHSTCSDSKFQLQCLCDQVRSLALIPTSQHGVVPDSGSS